MYPKAMKLTDGRRRNNRSTFVERVYDDFDALDPIYSEELYIDVLFWFQAIDGHRWVMAHPGCD